MDFVEVYQDQVRDLLINPNEDGTTRMPAIDVRESPTQGIFLEGVRYAAVPIVLEIDSTYCCNRHDFHAVLAPLRYMYICLYSLQ